MYLVWHDNKEENCAHFEFENESDQFYYYEFYDYGIEIVLTNDAFRIVGVRFMDLAIRGEYVDGIMKIGFCNFDEYGITLEDLKKCLNYLIKKGEIKGYEMVQ